MFRSLFFILSDKQSFTMTISKSDHPAYLTGGCLCNSIKYTLTFTDESPWPPLVRAINASYSSHLD